jgi:CheY-like chemotaxis protein
MSETTAAMGAAGTQGWATGPRPAGGPLPRAVVVEDDEQIAELWVTILEAVGYAVAWRDSGLGLVGLLRDWRPDVVLLDPGLPYRSGAAVLADLKADLQTAAIPVVVLSGAAEALPPARAAQAAAVLAKPVGPRHLCEVLAAAVRGGAAVAAAT